MQRILFIISATSTGGTSTSLENLFNHYRRDKWDIQVFAMQHNEERQVSYGGAMIAKQRLTSAFYCNYAKQKGIERLYVMLVKAMRRLTSILGIDIEPWVLRKSAKSLSAGGAYDVVVDYTGKGFETTRLALMVAGKKHVAWNHGFGQSDEAEQSKEKLYARFDALICVSKANGEKFAQLFPKLARLVVVVPNLLDKERIKTLSKATISDHRFERRGFTIVSVGRISAIKRFSKIPAIAATLKADGVPFRWYIIGPVYEAEEHKQLEQNIKVHGVDDCVIWLGGKDNPYPYIAAADVLACTSLNEAGPMTPKEALALGVPCICCDFPVAFEQITDGETGIIAPLERFPEAIEQLANDEEMRNRMKQHTAQSIPDNNDLLTIIEQTFEA